MCRILSLDGGGSWAMLQLLTLREKYKGMRGHQILQDFDLVIANSGGSITLACLVENWTPEEALELFRKKSERERIFSKNSFWESFFPADYTARFLKFGPKYSSVRKGRAFREIFKIGDQPMDKIPELIGHPNLKIIVCTYDALNNKAKFFRSYGIFPEYDSVRLTQAIHGSSNAPIQYFDFPARFKAKNTGIWYELWDGALGGFNNPVTAGIIEAIKCGYRKEEISVVSIGTSNKYMSLQEKERYYQVKLLSVKERKNKYRLWRLKYQLEFFKMSVMNQAKTILYEPPDWANYVAFMFLFDQQYHNRDAIDLKRFVRLSPVIHVDKNTPEDCVVLLNSLYKLDMNLTSDHEIALVEECFENWKNGLIANQSIEYTITRENELISLFGHATFDSAFQAWTNRQLS